jgi:1-aminocyclopropane-1-carboxylate deaminase/D-cysteine desulfhydrase-like pyridoxal-dependent ACC family enzyme
LLNHFQFTGAKCYVKREDELGFGISGSKLRKYLTLLPPLLAQKPVEAVVTGGAFSNHVLSISQLLLEHQIEPVLFLLGEPSTPLKGNLLWTRLFTKVDNLHWVARGNWHQLDDMASEYAQKRCEAGVNAIVIPKGGNGKGALRGAATLALDILQNEKEHGVVFDHVLIDAGTGLTACGLLHAFAYLEKSCDVHVVQIAGSANEFATLLQHTHQEWQTLLQTTSPFPKRFSLHTPRRAAAFGNVNQRVLRTVVDLARQEGFFTDPIYTAKLFAEGKELMQEKQWQGNVLFVHSGGSLSLSGFADQLAQVVREEN